MKHNSVPILLPLVLANSNKMVALLRKKSLLRTKLYKQTRYVVIYARNIKDFFYYIDKHFDVTILNLNTFQK